MGKNAVCLVIIFLLALMFYNVKKENKHANLDTLKKTLQTSKIARTVINCNKGKCKGVNCKCCPGYGIKESGLWSKSYSCEKCDCGEQFSCTFGWLGKTCICPTGYFGIGGLCLKCDCGGLNPCTFGWSGITCICPTGYRHIRGRCTADCSGILCKNGGICQVINNENVCKCRESYTGKQCEKKDPCFLNPCKNGGKCILSNGKATCQCSYRYTGDFCEKAFGMLEWGYSLVYYGAFINIIGFFILPVILSISLEDYILLWYLMYRFFLSKFQERHCRLLMSTVQKHNDVYNSICRLLKKILKTVAVTNLQDAHEDTDLMYYCPICCNSQSEIFLNKGCLYTLACGHLYCNECIANMEGRRTITCAICRKVYNRESIVKIYF